MIVCSWAQMVTVRNRTQKINLPNRIDILQTALQLWNFLPGSARLFAEKLRFSGNVAQNFAAMPPLSDCSKEVGGTAACPVGSTARKSAAFPQIGRQAARAFHFNRSLAICKNSKTCLSQYFQSCPPGSWRYSCGTFFSASSVANSRLF